MTEKAPARALRARPEGDSRDPDPVGQPVGDLWLPRGSSASGGSSPRRVADALGDLQRGLWRRGASLGLVDLLVAALLADLPGLCSESLDAERFVCLAREDHPEVGGWLDRKTSGPSATAS